MKKLSSKKERDTTATVSGEEASVISRELWRNVAEDVDAAGMPEAGDFDELENDSTIQLQVKQSTISGAGDGLFLAHPFRVQEGTILLQVSDLLFHLLVWLADIFRVGDRDSSQEARRKKNPTRPSLGSSKSCDSNK